MLSALRLCCSGAAPRNLESRQHVSPPQFPTINDGRVVLRSTHTLARVSIHAVVVVVVRCVYVHGFMYSLMVAPLRGSCCAFWHHRQSSPSVIVCDRGFQIVIGRALCDPLGSLGKLPNAVFLFLFLLFFCSFSYPSYSVSSSFRYSLGAVRFRLEADVLTSYLLMCFYPTYVFLTYLTDQTKT